MSKVAVTGAAGFIGAYLTRRLLDDGHDVLAIDNYVRGLSSRLDGIDGPLQRLTLDVRDSGALTRAFEGVDAVFHLAAVNGTENFYKQPALVLDVGVRGMLAVAEACLTAKVPDLIVASSAEVYQTPAIVPTPETIDLVIPNSLNPRYSYGGSKLISELIAFNYCRERLRKVQVFRPHNVYGPNMGWKHVIPQLIEKIRAAEATGQDSIELQGDGRETRAFCYVDDIVSGILMMWTRGAAVDVYHIGSMEEVAIGEIAKMVAQTMASDVTFLPGPIAPGGTPRRCPDIAKMRALGYEARVALRTGLDQTVEWYLANPRAADSNNLL